MDQPHIGMSTKNSTSLDDFVGHARENFPNAFEIIADPSMYKFESRRFSLDGGSLREGPLVHIAFWYSGKLNIRVWAHSDGLDVCYFFEKPGQALFNAAPPFPLVGRNLINAYQHPFALVPNRRKPHSSKKEEIKQAKLLARQRLTLLIHFAFLTTKHITEIVSVDTNDLLVQFKDLCIQVLDNRLALHDTETSSAGVKDEVIEVEAMDDSPLSFEHKTSMESIRDFRGSPSIVLRDSKRPAIDEHSVFGESSSSNPHKRPRTHSSGILRASHTDQSGRPSSHLQSIFETLIEECKTELEAGWAAERAASKDAIEVLRAQLTDERRRASDTETMVVEWKEKYQKLKDKLTGLMGDV